MFRLKFPLWSDRHSDNWHSSLELSLKTSFRKLRSDAMDGIMAHHNYCLDLADFEKACKDAWEAFCRLHPHELLLI